MFIPMSLEAKHVLEVENLVKPEYDKLKCWAHGWLHILGVRDSSKQLAFIEGHNPVPFEIAAYCHDLGRILEEKEGIVNNSPGFQNHALLSLEPTARILQQVGIDNSRVFGSIMEAVAIHSYKDYTGNNLIAKILRDSDKSDSIGAWGVLKTAKYHFNKDFVDTQTIMDCYGHSSLIENLANETLKKIKVNPDLRQKYIRILNFVCEWSENKMFHMPASYKLFEKEIEYTRKAKEFMLA